MRVSLTFFFLVGLGGGGGGGGVGGDSHLATLWESNCPFGCLLVMFPLESCYFVFVFSFFFDVSDEMCGIIVSIPDYCIPFYFKKLVFIHFSLT